MLSVAWPWPRSFINGAHMLWNLPNLIWFHMNHTDWLFKIGNAEINQVTVLIITPSVHLKAKKWHVQSNAISRINWKFWENATLHTHKTRVLPCWPDTFPVDLRGSTVTPSWWCGSFSMKFNLFGQNEKAVTSLLMARYSSVIIFCWLLYNKWPSCCF